MNTSLKSTLRDLLLGAALGAILPIAPAYADITSDGLLIANPHSAAALPSTIGEVVTLTVASGAPVTFTLTATPYNFGSVVLTQGRWLCQADLIVGAAGTTMTSLIVAFNSTPATLPTAPAGGYATMVTSATTTTLGGVNSGLTPILVTTATQTEYVVMQAGFTGTAPTGYGQANCIRVG